MSAARTATNTATEKATIAPIHSIDPLAGVLVVVFVAVLAAVFGAFPLSL